MSSILRWQRPDRSVWPTVGQLFGLRHDLEQLFEGPFSELSDAARLLRAWNPAIDVYEDKNDLFVKAELPGLKKEEIDVSLEDGVLTLTGERKVEQRADNAAVHRAERFVGRFQRSITLPTQVKGDQVKAHYQDGLLTITLPKADEVKTKQIEVKVA